MLHLYLKMEQAYSMFPDRPRWIPNANFRRSNKDFGSLFFLFWIHFLSNPNVCKLKQSYQGPKNNQQAIHIMS